MLQHDINLRLTAATAVIIVTILPHFACFLILNFFAFELFKVFLEIKIFCSKCINLSLSICQKKNFSLLPSWKKVEENRFLSSFFILRPMHGFSAFRKLVSQRVPEAKFHTSSFALDVLVQIITRHVIYSIDKHVHSTHRVKLPNFTLPA